MELQGRSVGNNLKGAAIRARELKIMKDAEFQGRKEVRQREFDEYFVNFIYNKLADKYIPKAVTDGKFQLRVHLVRRDERSRVKNIDHSICDCGYYSDDAIDLLGQKITEDGELKFKAQPAFIYTPLRKKSDWIITVSWGDEDVIESKRCKIM